MLKKLLSKMKVKGWGLSWGSDTSYPVRTSSVEVDPISRQLLFTSSYHQLAQNGYIENVVSNRCIREIAKAVNSIPVKLMIDGEEVDSSTRDRLGRSIINSMSNPDPDYSWCDLIEAVISHRKIIGRGFVYPEFSEVTGELLGVQYLRPDRVTETQSAGERILSYRYHRGAENIVFYRDDEGYFDLIDWRQFNPVSDVKGLGNIVPTALSIDGHTSGSKWNKEQLDNGHRDSGILTINDSEQSGMLDEEQITALKEKLKRETSNRYGIKIVNMPGKYEPIDLTPVEMDFVNSLNAKAIDICTGLDFPPYILGLESATFNNLAEAKLSLYENNAIPLAEDFYKTYSSFLSRKTGRIVEFKLCLREVIALAPRFQVLHQETRLDWDSDLITRDEAREVIGYEEVGGIDGDVYKSDLRQPVTFNQST